jgi:hypothetical protein
VRTTALLVLLMAAPVWADGGTVRARTAAGPFTVTVFTAPQPPAVGPVDVSVLVQDAGGAPVLDAEVRVRLTGPDGAADVSQNATRTAATNKLLYAAVADVPATGTWALAVDVRRGDDHGSVAAIVPVGPAAPPLRALWAYLALPPAGMLIFALHQSLAKRRRGVDRSSAITEDASQTRREDLDG